MLVFDLQNITRKLYAFHFLNRLGALFSKCVNCQRCDDKSLSEKGYWMGQKFSRALHTGFVLLENCVVLVSL